MELPTARRIPEIWLNVNKLDSLERERHQLFVNAE
jgi:hypothetical protein